MSGQRRQFGIDLMSAARQTDRRGLGRGVGRGRGSTEARAGGRKGSLGWSSVTTAGPRSATRLGFFFSFFLMWQQWLWFWLLMVVGFGVRRSNRVGVMAKLVVVVSDGSGRGC
ncbi:extensin [Iris pallida]|uniref:Extensin n=1 Tax=Iris pallida TaxID=29817 RepID=A0AAX6H4C2_IRIPA|nr:extensin [Iris pallida]